MANSPCFSCSTSFLFLSSSAQKVGIPQISVFEPFIVPPFTFSLVIYLECEIELSRGGSPRPPRPFHFTQECEIPQDCPRSAAVSHCWSELAARTHSSESAVHGQRTETDGCFYAVLYRRLPTDLVRQDSSFSTVYMLLTVDTEQNTLTKCSPRMCLSSLREEVKFLAISKNWEIAYPIMTFC